MKLTIKTLFFKLWQKFLLRLMPGLLVLIIIITIDILLPDLGLTEKTIYDFSRILFFSILTIFSMSIIASTFLLDHIDYRTKSLIEEKEKEKSIKATTKIQDEEIKNIKEERVELIKGLKEIIFQTGVITTVLLIMLFINFILPKESAPIAIFIIIIIWIHTITAFLSSIPFFKENKE